MTFSRRQHNPTLSILDTSSKCFSREASKDNVRDGTDASASQHGVCSFRHHWHVDSHNLSFHHSFALEGVSQLADTLLELGVSHLASFSWRVSFMNDRHLRSISSLHMSIDCVVAGIQLSSFEPDHVSISGNHCSFLSVQRNVAHSSIRVEPVDGFLGDLEMREREGGCVLERCLRGEEEEKVAESAREPATKAKNVHKAKPRALRGQ